MIVCNLSKCTVPQLKKHKTKTCLIVSVLTKPQGVYDSSVINKIKGPQAESGSSLHCRAPPGTFIGIMCIMGLL